ncbi:AraC family transcriptional regulator [Ruegeria atlantica]|nr:AraC family transcriptional regulator [Ruegeria atlantica]
MISAKALGAMPQFTLEVVGAKALDRALTNAGLPHDFVNEQDGYIPKHSLATFIDEVARALGDGQIGLMWAPALTVADYGAWGRYVLGAPTLGAALERARRAMPLHSSTDRTFFRMQGNLVGYEYRFGLKDHAAYPSIAFSALGSVLSIFRHFLGAAWKPHKISCDLDRPKNYDDVETTFGCPVVWNGNRLEIWFARKELTASVKCDAISRTTLEDLQRARPQGLPIRFPDIVGRVIQLQLDCNGISLEAVARSLDIGERGLQRRLQWAGTSFRELANQVTTNRAIELLRDGSLTVQEVATELGYENAQNLSRAISRNTGFPPSHFRHCN